MTTTHAQLVETLTEEGVLRTPVIIEAFTAVDRGEFVRAESEQEAYADIPLSIGSGQTISQPYTVAYLLELLQPQPGDVILDVGSGSGWQTALLAHVVSDSLRQAQGEGHVTAIEIIPELCEWGKENISKYSFIEKGIVEVHCMSGLNGYSERAPFDKIIAAAAGEVVPEAWMAQTKVGGSIVTPVGSSILQLTRRSETDWERYEHPGFAFVPLVEG